MLNSYDTRNFLVYSIECIRCFGFSKKSEGGYSTADRAADILADRFNLENPECAERYYGIKEKYGFNPANLDSRREAIAILEWVKSLDSERISEFMHKCQNIISQPRVTEKDFGFIAYLPIAYRREMARRAEREAEIEANRQTSPSNYIGKVGDKLIVEVTSAECVFSGEGFYGASFIYKFQDKAQNVIIWKTSKPLELEEVKTLRGTVKEQKEYKGIKQTVLTRCKVG